MTAILYTAVDRGTLASGHTDGTAYELETSSHKLDLVRTEEGSESVAQDGTTEKTLDRIQRGWNVLTDFIDEADRPSWDEFIDSVAAAEVFTFDAYGTIASADNAQTVIMDGEPKWSRVGASKVYQLSFRVRVL